MAVEGLAGNPVRHVGHPQFCSVERAQYMRILNIRFNVTFCIVIVFILVNLFIARKWVYLLFHSDNNRSAALVRFSDQIPHIEGDGYSTGKYHQVNANAYNLIIYLSEFGVTGRSIAALKFSNLLHEYTASGLRVTLITSGQLQAVKELLEENAISYVVINDSNRKLSARLGLNEDESGVFLFDGNGSCRFSSRQLVTPEDIRQLVAVEGIKVNDNDYDRVLSTSLVSVKGKALPSWPVVDVRSIRATNLDEIGAGVARLWVFFPIDWFSCGAPLSQRPLIEFDSWRKSGNKESTEPILVFDSGFRRSEVASALSLLRINSPAFVSKIELKMVAEFLQSEGRPADRPLAIRTDNTGAVISVQFIGSSRSRSTLSSPSITKSKRDSDEPIYMSIFRNLGLDIYDVASHGNLYCVSDRTRNSVLLLNEKFKVLKVIGGIGSAPNTLFRPGYIDVSANGIIYVQDGGNDRIQSFSIDGGHLGGFSPGRYSGFAANTEGELYLGQPEKGYLISVYTRAGQHLRSFGKLKAFSEVYGADLAHKNEAYKYAINRTRLFVDKDGSLFVSFTMAPLIQKYTRQGDLIFEKRLVGPEIDRYTKAVLTGSTGKYLTMSLDGFSEPIFSLEAIPLPTGEIAIILTDGSIYLADRDGHKIRILHPRYDHKFMPEMAGVTPAGELVLVGLNPRNCYKLSR